jgi:hypothetical protein
MGRSNEGKPGTRKTRYGKQQQMRMTSARGRASLFSVEPVFRNALAAHEYGVSS